MAKVGDFFQCEVYGKILQRTGRQQKYCPDCRKEKKSQRSVEWQRKNRYKVELGVEIPCERCGKTIIRQTHNHKYCSDCKAKEREPIYVECVSCGKIIRKIGSAKYCLDCRPVMYKKLELESLKARRETAKEEAAKYKKETPKLKFTLAEVEAAARKNNMHYGQYVSLWKIGKVEPPEKLPKKKRGRKKVKE